MFLLICKLYICIQNVFGHIFYSTRLHLYQQVWQFEVQKLAYMLILAAGGMIPYLSSVGGYPEICQMFSAKKIFPTKQGSIPPNSNSNSITSLTKKLPLFLVQNPVLSPFLGPFLVFGVHS